MSGSKEDPNVMLARIDERTDWIMKKLQEHCDWKASATIDIATLKESGAKFNELDLPNRVSRLENWRYYIAGVMALMVFLIGIRFVAGPTTWPTWWP